MEQDSDGFDFGGRLPSAEHLMAPSDFEEADALNAETFACVENNDETFVSDVVDDPELAMCQLADRTAQLQLPEARQNDVTLESDRTGGTIKGDAWLSQMVEASVSHLLEDDEDFGCVPGIGSYPAEISHSYPPGRIVPGEVQQFQQGTNVSTQRTQMPIGLRPDSVWAYGNLTSPAMQQNDANVPNAPMSGSIDTAALNLQQLITLQKLHQQAQQQRQNTSAVPMPNIIPYGSSQASSVPRSVPTTSAAITAEELERKMRQESRISHQNDASQQVPRRISPTSLVRAFEQQAKQGQNLPPLGASPNFGAAYGEAMQQAPPRHLMQLLAMQQKHNETQSISNGGLVPATQALPCTTALPPPPIQMPGTNVPPPLPSHSGHGQTPVQVSNAGNWAPRMQPPPTGRPPPPGMGVGLPPGMRGLPPRGVGVGAPPPPPMMQQMHGVNWRYGVVGPMRGPVDPMVMMRPPMRPLGPPPHFGPPPPGFHKNFMPPAHMQRIMHRQRMPAPYEGERPRYHMHYQRGADNWQLYGDLLSRKERDWLVRIYTLALHETGNPYVDDFYWTMYKNKQFARERARMGKSALAEYVDESNATQPAYVYTPPKFEGSLGKPTLVTALQPRTLIDVAAVGHGELGAEAEAELGGAVGIVDRGANGHTISPDVDTPTTITERSASAHRLAHRRFKALMLDIENCWEALLHAEEVKRHLTVTQDKELGSELAATLHALLTECTRLAYGQRLPLLFGARKGATLVARSLALAPAHIGAPILADLGGYLPQVVKRMAAIGAGEQQRITTELWAGCRAAVRRLDSVQLAAICVPLSRVALVNALNSGSTFAFLYPLTLLLEMAQRAEFVTPPGAFANQMKHWIQALNHSLGADEDNIKLMSKDLLSREQCVSLGNWLSSDNGGVLLDRASVQAFVLKLQKCCVG